MMDSHPSAATTALKSLLPTVLEAPCERHYHYHHCRRMKGCL